MKNIESRLLVREQFVERYGYVGGRVQFDDKKKFKEDLNEIINNEVKRALGTRSAIDFAIGFMVGAFLSFIWGQR